MKTTLLTGASGFVGKHVSEKLACDPLSDSQGKPIDLRDLSALRDFLTHRELPDQVLHLGGISNVGNSFANAEETMEVNFWGTFHLLSLLKELGFKGRVLYVGSADIYGLVSELELPVTERQIPKPRNPYAVSKFSAETLAYQMSQTEDFEVVLARPFNHIGAGQSPGFVVSDMACQIAEIKSGKRAAKLEVGDIDVTRDFTDVRDIVRAYHLLLEKGKNGEVYNICSGVERRVRDLIEKMLSIASVEAEIVQDPSRLRKSEQRRMVGSFAKLREATGWKPEIEVDQSLRDILSRHSII